MINYVLRHLQVLIASLGQLVRNPGAAVMTILAIGITLALPAILHLLIDNIQNVTQSWRGRAQVSVFLARDSADSQHAALNREIAARPEVENTLVISAEEALREFKEASGIHHALEALGHNPLPASIIVHIRPEFDQPHIIESLVADLKLRPEIEAAQWDLAWLKRLHVILRLAQRAVTILTVLLVVAVIVIINNTIRLSILNHREEIEVMKLIGATEGFIRRPFLYGGLLQGLLGALVAWLLVAVCLQLFQHPVAELTALYNSNFRLRGIDTRTLLVLLGGGGLLGWLAARGSVARHLSRVEPQ